MSSVLSGLTPFLAIGALAAGLLACSPQPAAKPSAPAAAANSPAPQQAAPAAPSGTGEPIRLGAVVPLTGRYASIGAPVRNGYELAIEDVNAAGGVSVGGVRRPLELRLYDDESDPAKTVQRLETLYAQDRVVAYLGGAGSDLHAAGAAIGDKNRIPYLGIGFALYDIHTRGLKYLFSPFPKSPGIVQATYELLNSLPDAERPRRVALFSERTDWGLEMGRLYAEQAPRYGYQIVVSEEYAPGTKDFSDLILKAKAAGAEAVIGEPNPPDGMTLVKQMRELDFNPKFIMLSRAADGVVWTENLGKDGDYVVYSPGWHYAAKYPGVAELTAKHQARYGRPADVLTGPAYALIQILTDAMQRAGKLDGESLRQALADTNLPSSVIGPVRFNPDGTGVVDYLLPQWQNGKSELIWPREQASAPFAYPAPPFAQR
jgi:branched-chain amino acid transport system substrate-binding protein